MPEETVRLIEKVLRESDLPCDHLADRQVMTTLAGEHKRTIPLLLTVGDRSLSVVSMFATVLDEGHREVYELLLHRNERSRHLHFALDDVGHVVLVGRIPLVALSESVIGDVLGECLDVADSAYNAVLRAGFATYIAHEQAWRASVGLSPNPVQKTRD